MSDGNRKLWFAVLEQATKDAEGDVKGPYNKYIKEGARVWFRRENQGIGSFLWVCLMLDLNPEVVRKRVAKKCNGSDIGVGRVPSEESSPLSQWRPENVGHNKSF
jgi:hypothetical protein